MSDKFQFSVIVFAQSMENLDKTYNSIKGHNAQLVLVILDEQIYKEEGFRQIEADSLVTIINASDGRNILPELKDRIKGGYINFIKNGVTYDRTTLKLVHEYAVKENKDIVATPVRGKHNVLVREHAGFCRRFNEETTLDSDAYILHNIYAAYFFKTEKFVWQEEFIAANWCLEVLKLVYANVMTSETFGVAAKTYVHIESGAAAVLEWLPALYDEEGLKNFYENFLLKLVQINGQEHIKHELNSEYVMLYYCVKMAGAIYQLEDLNEADAMRYSEFVDDVMRKIRHSRIIIANQHINKVNKYYLLRKYFQKVKPGYSERADVIVKPEFDKVDMAMFRADKDSLHIEFASLKPVDREYQLELKVGDKYFPCVDARQISQVGWCKETTAYNSMYMLDIPYEDVKESISWSIRVGDSHSQMYNLSYRKYTPFTKSVFLYVNVADKLFYLSDKQIKASIEDGEENILAGQYEIIVKTYDKKLESELAAKRTKSLMKLGKVGIKAVLARKLYEKKKADLKKQVWLISDRTNRADDNGEVMFRYMCANPDETVEPYFVVDKDTADYREMSKIGKVTTPFSREHKLLFLLSEFLLSSQANKAVVNPFGRLEYLYRDLMYDKRLVFLQHGVTKDNQSKWLNKYNRNLFGFVVSTKPEYDSVFEYDYFYGPENVWLTGMPRYDRLYHDERKYITVMPTWRKSLSAGTDAQGVWLLGDEFAGSDYFKFYDTLLNDKRLLDAADKYGYKICFMPHPNTIAGIGMFHRDDRVMFMDTSFSYKDVFAQTDLMVTDYSSVAFDFAYLRKPIVYAQFDKEEFFNGEHSYTEGYFDYERDGFGEVEQNLEAVIDRVIEYMENGCKMKEKYLSRIDATFAFSDQNCSKRVYEEIIKYRQNKIE